MFPEYFWIPRQKFPKSLYFEIAKLDAQICRVAFTDLCVTVQLYTQISACCWLGSKQQQQHGEFRRGGWIPVRM